MRRIVVATALLLVLVPGLAAAQPRAGETSVKEAITTLFREVVVQFWVSAGGCRIDPNGTGCTPQPVGPTIDGGCTIDPNGSCKP
jgi:hypothetical protein